MADMATSSRAAGVARVLRRSYSRPNVTERSRGWPCCRVASRSAAYAPPGLELAVQAGPAVLKPAEPCNAISEPHRALPAWRWRQARAMVKKGESQRGGDAGELISPRERRAGMRKREKPR